jgi:hypothetical protein
MRRSRIQRRDLDILSKKNPRDISKPCIVDVSYSSGSYTVGLLGFSPSACD